MAGGVNPFGFSMGVLPAPRAPRQPKDLPSAPFGFAPPPSKMQQTLAILNEYNPLPAFERLLKSPMALGGPISESDIADGLTVAGGVMGGGAMAPKPKNALNMGIKAYHGSPHDFDRFDMSKIGTGEGAQAYGHGLYFAENEGIAKNYRDALSASLPDVEYKGKPLPVFTGAPMREGQSLEEFFASNFGSSENPSFARDAALSYKKAARERLSKSNDFPSSVKKRLLQEADEEIAALEAFDPNAIKKLPKGRMYEVEINADPDAFLDWDKPLSEQGAIDRFSSLPEFARPLDEVEAENVTGQRLHQRLANKLGEDGASTALRKAGIPGIKYLDAGSRGAGDGTRNFVVFDDKLIEIVRKYGIAGASAMLGYNILDGMDPAQADELKRIEGNQ